MKVSKYVLNNHSQYLKKGNCLRFSTVHEHKCPFFSHKTTPGAMMTAIREIQEVMRRNHCLANKG